MIVHSSDVEYCCASKKHIKKFKLHHNQPAVGDDNVPQVEPQRAENHDEPVVMLPKNDQKPLHAREDHQQPTKNAAK